VRVKEVVTWVEMGEVDEYGRGLVVSCPLIGVNLPQSVG